MWRLRLRRRLKRRLFTLKISQCNRATFILRLDDHPRKLICKKMTITLKLHTLPSTNRFTHTSMVCSTKVLCPQKRYKSRMSRYVDIGHLCFWHTSASMMIIDKITIFCNNINNKHFHRITSNKYSMLRHKKVNVGLGIKSMARLKTFLEEWNGHNAFVHPLKFDELLQ